MELDMEKQPIWIVFNSMCLNWMVVGISRDWGIMGMLLERGEIL